MRTLLLLLLVLVGSAARAVAHDQLEQSEPRAGAVLAASPAAVTLTFGEPVERSSTSITVVDDHLRAVTTGPVTGTGSSGTTVSVSLPAALARGTYTVSWQVSSADTHPVSGSFRFSVGAPSVVTGTVAAGTNDVAGLLLGFSRTIGFVGLVLAPGLALGMLVLWPAGVRDRRTRSLLWTGLGLLVASTLGGRLLQGVWSSGAPMSTLWSSPAALDTHSRRFDVIMGLRFYLVIGFAAVLATTLRLNPTGPSTPTGPRGPRATVRRARRDVVPSTGSPRSTDNRLGVPPLLVAALAALAVSLTATWAVAGHSAVGDLVPVAVSATIAHLLAMSVWLGGLVLVAVSLTSTSRAGDLAAALPRFSRLAFGCVCVMVSTGAYLAWREVASVGALTSTEYGRLLIVKLVGVATLVGLGNLGRRWVQRHLRPGAPSGQRSDGAGEVVGRPEAIGPSEIGRLRRGVVGEVAIGLAVLSLTSALVVILPARQEPATARPATAGPVSTHSTTTSLVSHASGSP